MGLIVWDLFIRKHPLPEPEISYQYVTDTVWDSIPYAVLEPYPVYTPPRIVTFYEVDSTALDSLVILLHNQDLLIASLLGRWDTISQAYIKQYPSNPKLLAIDLKRDTMSMWLLNITGIPQEDKWPIDLARFDYRWNYAAGLSRHSTSSPPIKEQQPFANYFVGGGVDLLYLSPYISGRIEKDWARIRLYGNIDAGLLKKESSGIKLGVDYKLNGKIRVRNE